MMPAPGIMARRVIPVPVQWRDQSSSSCGFWCTIMSRCGNGLKLQHVCFVYNFKLFYFYWVNVLTLLLVSGCFIKGLAQWQWDDAKISGKHAYKHTPPNHSLQRLFIYQWYTWLDLLPNQCMRTAGAPSYFAPGLSDPLSIVVPLEKRSYLGELLINYYQKGKNKL